MFLLNSRRDFCVNYFLDTEHLAVEDRNRFTAMEVATCCCPRQRHHRGLLRPERLGFEQLPGADRAQPGGGRWRHFRKRRWERRLSGRWARPSMAGACDSPGGTGRSVPPWTAAASRVALRTRSYVSKHHPRNFQQRVLDASRQAVRTGTPCGPSPCSDDGRVLTASGYFYRLDPKQWRDGRPYPPLGTLQLAAVLREAGHEVEVFDTGLRHGRTRSGRRSTAGSRTWIMQDDGFNYLTKMPHRDARGRAAQ